jgi:hypothetical protein
MTRRRLILAACVAVVALGAAWWLCGDGLSVGERRLLGTWQFSENTPARIDVSRSFRVDRTFEQLIVSTGSNTWYFSDSGVWRIRGNSLIIDREGNLIHHAIQSLRRMLGFSNHQVVCRLEWLSSVQIAVTSGVTREVYTRISTD